MIYVLIVTRIDGKLYKFNVADTVLNDETKIADIGLYGNALHLVRRTPPLETERAPVTNADSLGDRFGPQNMHSNGFLAYRNGHTSIANNRTGSSTGTDLRSATVTSSNNNNAGEQNINSFANSSPREIGYKHQQLASSARRQFYELFDTEVFDGVQSLSMSDWSLHRSLIATTRIQSASTSFSVHVQRHTSQFMGQFLPRSPHHFESNWVQRMPVIRPAHRLDMSTFSSSSTLHEFRPINGRQITDNRNLTAESNGCFPCIFPISIPGGIIHIEINATSSSNNAQAREQENKSEVEQTLNDNEDQSSVSTLSPPEIEFLHEPEVEQTSGVDNDEQTNNSVTTQPDVINGIIPEDSIRFHEFTMDHDIPSELSPETTKNSSQKRSRTKSTDIDANLYGTSNKQRKMD